MMTRAAVYYRVSTQEQAADHKVSLPTQHKACEGLCAARDWEIVGVYEDAGVSGRKADRPALTRMLADAAAGKFDRVVFYKIDRFGRSVKVIYDTWDELEAAGLMLVSATEPIDTTTPIGKAMKGIISVFAELEVDTFRERSMNGKVGMAQQGRWTGGPSAFGYDVEESRLVINEAEAVIVKRIFRDYVGGRTQRQIAKSLANEGVPTKNGGGPWSQLRISDILRNQIYLGRAHYGKSKLVKKTPQELEDSQARAEAEGRDPAKVSDTKQVKVEDESKWIEIRCPAIVDEDLWEAAQVKADRNLRDSHRQGPRENPYLLTNLFRCEPCGGAMIGKTAETSCRGKKYVYHYYLCVKQHHYGTGCRTPEAIRAEGIDAAVWGALVTAFSSPQHVLTACQAYSAQAAEELANESGRVEALHRSLEKADQERSKVITWARQGRITEQDLDRQKDEIDKEIGDTQAELDRLEQMAQQRVVIKELEASVDGIAEMVRTQADAVTLDERKALVSALIEKVTLSADNAIRISCIVPGLLEPDSATATASPGRRQVASPGGQPLAGLDG